MLDFLKKLFAAKTTAPAVPEAPYKIEAPIILVDGSTVTVGKPAEVSSEDVQSSWPFPDTKPTTARKPRTPRVAKPADSTATAAKKPRAARQPRVPKTTS